MAAGAAGRPAGYEALEYDDDMPTSLAAADLVVCRSRASNGFELLAAGLPSVLVPSPFVTADHQTANARHLARAGAAVVVPDAELDGARLVAEVDALLARPAVRDERLRPTPPPVPTPPTPSPPWPRSTPVGEAGTRAARPGARPVAPPHAARGERRRRA